MPLPLNRPINSVLEGRRGEVERQRSVQGGSHRISGFVEVAGAGEVLADVNFPVWFIERPSMSFGGELGPNEPLEVENYPTVSVMVKSWAKRQKAGADYFTGATLIVVTSGPEKQRVIAHWQMEGRALVNPLLSTGSTSDAI